jgi:CMP/dCMP kinase
VVAPAAVLKVYLVASEEERARRRQRQDDVAESTDGGPPGRGGDAAEAGAPDDPGALDATRAAIHRRDTIDSTRAASPLAVAADAVVLDTTGLSVDGVVAEVLTRYRAALDAAERA